MHRALLAREIGDNDAAGVEDLVRVNKVNDWSFKKYRSHGKRVLSLDVESSEGRYLLCGLNGNVEIFDLWAPEERMEIIANGNTRLSRAANVLWYPGDTALFLVGSSSPGDLQMWDTNTLTYKTRRRTGEVKSMAISPCSTHHDFVAVCAENFGTTVALLDLQSGTFAHELAGHSSTASTVAFSPHDEYLLASGDDDGSILFWDIRKAGRAACVFAFDGLKLEVDDQGYGEVVYGPRPRRRKRRPPRRAPQAHFEGRIRNLLFTSDGRHLLSSSRTRIRTWDTVTGYCLADMSRACPNTITNAVSSVPMAMTADPHILYVPDRKHIAVYELYESEALRYLPARHYEDISLLAANPIREELYSADLDGDLLVWGSP